MQGRHVVATAVELEQSVGQIGQVDSVDGHSVLQGGQVSEFVWSPVVDSVVEDSVGQACVWVVDSGHSIGQGEHVGQVWLVWPSVLESVEDWFSVVFSELSVHGKHSVGQDGHVWLVWPSVVVSVDVHGGHSVGQDWISVVGHSVAQGKHSSGHVGQDPTSVVVSVVGQGWQVWLSVVLLVSEVEHTSGHVGHSVGQVLIALNNLLI